MEITSLPYFAFPHSRRRCFLIYLLTIQWQAAEINVIFNEMLFEQSVTSSTNNECPPRSGKNGFHWIDQVSVKGSFNKTEFFCENNLSENNK